VVSELVAPARPVRPTARIQVQVQGRSIALDGSDSQPARPSGPPVVRYRWSQRPGNPQPLHHGPADTARFKVLTPPTAAGEYYVTLEVADEEGRSDRSTTYFAVDAGGPRAVDMAREAPAWTASAVVYGVIPCLFGEHPFADVTDRLAYLRDLGVNALWLSPITGTPPGDFGYAVTDYFHTNPRYGSEDEFRTLVGTAHGHGIRVLIDFVPNHTSDQHPYFVDAERHGRRSPYHSFYDRDADGRPTHYFDWTNLPNLNYSNADVEAFMTEAFTYWVREFDVDGFRVDACWGVRQRRPDYWPRWRAELKRVKPDLLLIAEATARDAWYLENGFDVGYDWTDELGRWAWQDVFADAGSLPAALSAALAADPEPGRVFHFLNNNDTGRRFIDATDPGTTRVAAALLLTLPGIPCVYTGDEIGASYMPYGDGTPLVWEDESDLRPWYQTLIHLRTSSPSLHSSAWTELEVGPQQRGLVGYLRHLPDRSKPLLVLLNFGRDALDATVEVPAGFQAVRGARRFRDLVGRRAVTALGTSPLTIHQDALSACVLEPEEAV
jgi:cyclomaltodextrinase